MPAAAPAPWGGPDANSAYGAAVEAVPADSWTARCLRTARTIVASAPDWETAAQQAVDQLAVHKYYWADLAPEAVGLTFTAVLAGRGDARETILNAVNLGRDADTIAAMAGAVAGAMAGIEAMPQDWLAAVAVAPGICLQTTKGMHPMEVADELVELANELQGTA